MALKGNIKTFSLADIFQLIGIQRKTGVLTLKRKDESVQVFFKDGQVVSAESSLKKLEDRIGTVLVKSGKISEEQLGNVLKTQKETLQKMGHLLISENLVQSEDMKEALQIQVTQIIYRLFRWKDGDYTFEERTSIDYDKEHFTPMSAESILMEGARMIDEWPIIERKISSFEMVFEKVGFEVPEEEAEAAELEPDEAEAEEEEEDLDSIFGEEEPDEAAEAGEGEPSEERDDDELPSSIQFSREEKPVYKMVDGKRTVQDVIERVLLNEFEVCRAFYDLWTRNLIAPVAKKESPKAEVPVKKSSPLEPFLAKAPYAVLVLWLLLTPVLMKKNPLNFFIPPIENKVTVIQDIKSNVGFVRMERIKKSIELYRLVKGSYPDTLEELVSAGILSVEDLNDPWGEPYVYKLSAQGKFKLSVTPSDSKP